jgi:hypothetical protein
MTDEPEPGQLQDLAARCHPPLPDPTVGPIRPGRLSQLDPPMARWVLNQLYRAGYRTIAQVDELTDDQILQTPGFGNMALQAIRASRHAGVRRPPTHETPLTEALKNTTALGKLVNSTDLLVEALEAIGVRTAEELVLVDHELLYEACWPHARQPRVVIHRLRQAAHDTVAAKHTADSDEILTAAQMRELVSLLGQLSECARQDHNNILERRTIKLQHLFVPGYPELGVTDARSPQPTDDPRERPRSNIIKPSN